MITFKISGTTLDLGVILRLNDKLVTSKDVIAPTEEDTGSVSVKILGSYLQYNIEGYIIGLPTTTQRAFKTAIKDAEKYSYSCTYNNSDDDSTNHSCYVYSYDFLKSDSHINRLYYVLVINEGTPL